MGVVNVTPDSFSGDGLYLRPDAAVAEAYGMLDCGAAIVDVGGESTRRLRRCLARRRVAPLLLPVLEGYSRRAGLDRHREGRSRGARPSSSVWRW